MNYAVQDIVEHVRIVLDQNRREDEPLVRDIDTLELDDIIRKHIVTAATGILKSAPLWEIDTSEAIPTEHATTMTTVGGVAVCIPLPTDWLRLSVAKLADWEVPVRNVMPDDSDAYKAVHSAFKGIRPSVRRPLAVLGDGELLLFGSAESKPEIEKARYVAIPYIKDETLRFPAGLYDQLVSVSAAMASVSYHDDNHARGLTAFVGTSGEKQDSNDNNRD